MAYYDDLETRSADQRLDDLMHGIRGRIAHAKNHSSGIAAMLADVDHHDINDLSDLAKLPVMRKSELVRAQTENAPFGGYTAAPMDTFSHVFQSPGPIYEPGRVDVADWWRMARFLHASGIGAGDIVQNCFSYHFTPAGLMFESGARAVGATVFPAGTGQTELQARAAADVGITAYAGTPDYLKVILDKGLELGLDLSGITKATVSGGALFPALRAEYADRGIDVRQCYATADVGSIAYESDAMEGMIVDERVLVEIVTPGTGNPVAIGEVGEVLVTSLNPDYPLIRFATGDLSAVMPGDSPCGRTNTRIVGWRGRADQAAKVKGMFVRPEQVADFVALSSGVERARVIVARDGLQDVLTVQAETSGGNSDQIASDIKATLKLRANVDLVAVGSLPRDGIVIEDRREID